MLDNPYFKLLRIPNIFTVPPDIILGFLIAQISLSAAGLGVFNTNNSVTVLVTLIFSSITLYLGGLVSNDLFDIKNDRIERPSRPLASGKIQKKSAWVILIILFTTGFSLSVLVNIVTAGISLLLIILILSYNYRLKSGYYRPFAMGAIRSLNIIYGFSFVYGFVSFDVLAIYTNFNLSLVNILDHQYLVLMFLALISIFFHIFILTFLSSRETAKEFAPRNKREINVVTILFVYIFFLFIIGIVGYNFVQHPITFILFIAALGAVVSLVYYKAHKQMVNLPGSLKMQFIVKNMLVMLILLDSAFIAGISGPLWGISTASLIFPSLLLSKRISMT